MEMRSGAVPWPHVTIFNQYKPDELLIRRVSGSCVFEKLL